MYESDNDVLATRERQETEVNLCLAAAQLNLAQGDYNRSEKLYRRAVRWGVQRWGAKSANVGAILLELQDLYDLQGLLNESKNIERDVHVILRHYFFKVLQRRVCFELKSPPGDRN